jgi:hypothetical protein
VKFGELIQVPLAMASRRTTPHGVTECELDHADVAGGEDQRSEFVVAVELPLTGALGEEQGQLLQQVVLRAARGPTRATLFAV